MFSVRAIRGQTGASLTFQQLKHFGDLDTRKLEFSKITVHFEQGIFFSIIMHLIKLAMNSKSQILLIFLRLKCTTWSLKNDK